MIRIIIFAILLFQIPQANASAPLCKNLFSKNQLDSSTSLNKNSTKSFIAYFQESLDNQIIGINEIKKFLLSLEKNTIINPIPHEDTPFGPLFLKSIHQIHFEAFEEIIKNSQLDFKILKNWARNFIQKTENATIKRDETRNTTAFMFQKVIFNRIEPGEFNMNSNQSMSVLTSITKPYELMATPVTQLMWARLKIAVGETDIKKINPSKFKDKDESLKLNISGFEVLMQPNHPVETLSWNEVTELLTKVNELSKSDNNNDQDILAEIFPNHKKNDIYRLPTHAEWDFVLKGRGKLNDHFFFGNNATLMKDYAWTKLNSDEQTQSVGQKKPLIINDMEFFDMLGNVREWVQDWHEWQIKGGADPQGPSEGDHKITRGGSWMDSSLGTIHSPLGMKPGDKLLPIVGFRIVREVN